MAPGRHEPVDGVVDASFSELRADMNTRFVELREDMNTRFTAVDQRIKTLNWSMTVWLSLLTLLIVLFKFLRF